MRHLQKCTVVLGTALLALPLLAVRRVRVGGGDGDPPGDPGPPDPIVLAHGAIGMEAYGVSTTGSASSPRSRPKATTSTSPR